MTHEELTLKIDKLLSDNKIFAETWFDPTFRAIRFEIRWGDWKHEHLRADCLIDTYLNSLNLPNHHIEKVTEEDGSDCYSAEHIYFVTI